MHAVTSPRPERTIVKRQEAFEDESHPQAKRPRSEEDFQIPRHGQLPKWLTQGRDCRASHESNRVNPLGNNANRHLSCAQAENSQERDSENRHARVYVGNLPKHLRLANAAYKELFSALYVTAFGALKPGEVSPVQQFWVHACKKYGFLQMRGSMEAVNILLFNGLSLHGKTLKLNRPTGYRPEVRNLSAEEYVPDKVDGERMDVLVKDLCGVIAAPREKTYLMALEQPMEGNKGFEVIEKLSTLGSDVAERSDIVERDIEIERIGMGTAEEEQKRNNSGDADVGTVVTLVSMAKFFDLEDQEEYEDILRDVREEYKRFGQVENVVIRKEGVWAGTTFVQFAKPSQAQQAVKGMDRRRFEGRKIQAFVVEGYETAEEASKRFTMPSI